MKYILILLLSLTCLSKAEAQYNNIDFQYKDMSFLMGYGTASFYDLAYKKKQTDVHSVSWKVGLGLMSGLAVALGHASNENSAIPFSDIIFGGLGGLTCTVIHF